MTKAIVDADGERIAVGDALSFAFGIPPQRVEGILGEDRGKMIFTVTSPDHVKPRHATMAQMKKWGIDLRKIGRLHTR